MIPRRSDRLAAGRSVLKRSNDVASAVLPVPSDIHSRDAALAPLRLDCGLRQWNAAFGPPPDRRQTAPSLRLPLKGGVILVHLMRASSITPPLRGSRTSPSRMAKACAEGGSHKASQRRDLVRRRGVARANLQAKADAEGGQRGVP